MWDANFATESQPVESTSWLVKSPFFVDVLSHHPSLAWRFLSPFSPSPGLDVLQRPAGECRGHPPNAGDDWAVPTTTGRHVERVQLSFEAKTLPRTRSQLIYCDLLIFQGAKVDWIILNRLIWLVFCYFVRKGRALPCCCAFVFGQTCLNHGIAFGSL